MSETPAVCQHEWRVVSSGITYSPEKGRGSVTVYWCPLCRLEKTDPTEEAVRP